MILEKKGDVFMDIFSMFSLLDGDPSTIGFCTKTAAIWQLVGKILFVIKIVFPLLVVIWGIIDIGKSVVASKPEDIKNSFKSFLFRLGAAIAIFFIPAIVSFGIGLANGFSEQEQDYEVCRKCIEHPNKVDQCNPTT